jgi:hypothetical protein
MDIFLEILITLFWPIIIIVVIAILVQNYIKKSKTIEEQLWQMSKYEKNMPSEKYLEARLNVLNNLNKNYLIELEKLRVCGIISEREYQFAISHVR